MKLLGAIKQGTNEYVYPRIANKIDKYDCPVCHEELILRQGKIRTRHFAHYKRDDPCNYYSNPSESQIHNDAKMLLKTLLENKTMINIIQTCDKCHEKEEYEIGDTSHISIEYRFEYNGTKIADVAYTDHNQIVCLFEIYNTHKTEDKNRPEPWYEIDASCLINKANSSHIDLLKIDCIRSILCEKCIKRKRLCYICSRCGDEYAKYLTALFFINKLISLVLNSIYFDYTILNLLD